MKIAKRAQAMSTAIGGLTALVTVIILFVVLALVSSFGSDIVQDTTTDLSEDVPGCGDGITQNCSQAYNNTINAQEGIGNLTAKFPTLANVLIGAFIILILVGAFSAFIMLRR